MTEPDIHSFTHHAMATFFQVRIAGEERDYASQAAREAFDVVDHLESLLSRFRENSEICQISRLLPGEVLRLSEPAFACLEIAQRMEAVTKRAFCVAPTALRTQSNPPEWSLLRSEFSIRCDAGHLDFDLGAIGKGFALDRMAEELGNWGCRSFLLVAGGSSILAGAPPEGLPGWSSGLGEDNSAKRYWLANCSLSGSGLAVKGEHIFDPRTGKPAQRHSRAWAIASTAAESDALSTTAMVLSDGEISECLRGRGEWLVLLNAGDQWDYYGARCLPPPEIVVQLGG